MDRTIRDRTIVKDSGGNVMCNLRTLGEYLLWLEVESAKKEAVANKRYEQLVGELARLNSVVSKMDTRIGLKTERAVRMKDTREGVEK